MERLVTKIRCKTRKYERTPFMIMQPKKGNFPIISPGTALAFDFFQTFIIDDVMHPNLGTKL